MTLFHFDLRHVPDASALGVRVSGTTTAYDLQPHSASSLDAARQQNAALAALPPQAQQAFTHFAEVDAAPFQQDQVRWIRAVRPAAPGVHLPELVLMTQYVPEGHLRAFYQAKFRLRHLPAGEPGEPGARPRLYSAQLARLGLQGLPGDQDAALEVLVSAQSFVDDMSTAAALLAQHPALANIQPYTVAKVKHDHILPDPEVDPDQYNAMQALASAITADPSWSPVLPCKDQHGKPLTAGYDAGDLKTGQQLYTWGLIDPVRQAAAPAANRARRTASDDMQLRNQLWSPTPGTTALVQSGNAPAAPPALAGEPAYKWTVDEHTEHYGISVDQDSIHVDESDNFAIDASNTYLRTISTGYQLFSDAAATMPVGPTRLLGSMSAVDTLLGIPMPAEPVNLAFNLQGAAAVKLYFGSLGTTDWNGDVSPSGALLTGAWQYGIPLALMVLSAQITSTKEFNQIVDDPQLRAAALGILFPIVGGGVATAAALGNTKTVLTAFGDVVLGFVVQKGMEKLGEWLVEQAAEGAISTAFGPVGQAFRLLADAMDFKEIAETTIEVLASPASFTVKVSRALDVALKLHPDPRHGEAGKPETAVWPSVARNYVATLQYKNGTNKKIPGQLPETTSNTPIPLVFEDVAAGGEFRIIAGLYSASGWLAGSWQSDWLEAKPTQGTTLQLGDQSITENLVPLAADAQYVYKEQVAYRNGAFSWQAGGPPPAITRAALDCGDGGTLCEVTNLTLNNSAFQVGYAWRASGQHLRPDTAQAPASDAQLYAVQNLSVLADPGSRLKTTSVGFTSRPAIAYAPSTNSPKQIDQTNFVLDPRGGGMHLRQVVLDDGQPDFGLGGSALQSWGRFPLENIDALAIHPSSAAIACSWQDHKLMILNLPAAPSPDSAAPVALLVSGEGLRQGLVQGPRALAVTPDGRILVLETVNERVQAFDTKGNPVPSFTPGPSLFQLPLAQVAASLDAGQVPEVFQAALQTGGITALPFSLSSSFTSQLDSARFQPEKDPLITALSEQGVILAYDPGHMDDPTASAQIQVVQAGQSWIITDPRHMAWQVRKQDEGLAVFHRLTRVEVRVEEPGQQWLLIDHGTGDAWRLTASTAAPGQAQVRSCLSYFPLRGAQPPGPVTCLDMAVEAQGYVYILSYANDGSQPADYLLDVYGPDGSFVLRTPDPSVTADPQNVVASRIAVDIWRNLYAVTFETVRGPGGAPQPGLAHWNPTPPLFTLPLANQADFNQRNIGTVTQAFSQHQITLSAQAFITVDQPEGAWQVKDGTTIYHVYRSGDGLQVYTVPA